MSETVLVAILGGSTLVQIAILGFVMKLYGQVGKMNGKVERHEKMYRACPLCPDKEVN
jgi:hypothetical protein